MLACSLVGLAAALVLCANVLAQKQPVWVVVLAGLAVFPVLPLLWHGMVDPGSRGGAVELTPRSRFALRCLAVALMVTAVSLADLGPKRVGQNLRELVGRLRAGAKPEAVPFPPAAAAKHHGLESFIPADARLVVGLAGATAMEKVLAAQGVDTREKLGALATCRIDFASVRILIATRGQGTQMIVMRANGLADEGNLYCLVGVMGPERLQVRSDAGGRFLQVNGFLANPIAFRVLDQTTLIAIDQPWQETAGEKLFADDLATATGRLALPLLRVERTTPLWLASVDDTEQGAWDLAFDARQDGNLLRLQGSATPPSGDADRAEFSVRVPAAFALALPESAVTSGIRSVVAALVGTNTSSTPFKLAPAPAAPAAVARDGGGR